MGLHDASNIVSMASYRHMARTRGRQKDVGRRQEERKHRKKHVNGTMVRERERNKEKQTKRDERKDMREVVKQTTAMTTASIQKPIASTYIPTVSHYPEGLDE